jgi:hypothetical protein
MQISSKPRMLVLNKEERQSIMSALQGSQTSLTLAKRDLERRYDRGEVSFETRESGHKKLNKRKVYIQNLIWRVWPEGDATRK